MLPWLFAVLLVLNVVLFYWGYQRQQSQEPVVPPLPEGAETIRLLSEVDTAIKRDASQRSSSDARSTAPEPAEILGDATAPAAGAAGAGGATRVETAVGIQGPDRGSAAKAQDRAIEGLGLNGDPAGPKSAPLPEVPQASPTSANVRLEPGHLPEPESESGKAAVEGEPPPDFRPTDDALPTPEPEPAEPPAHLPAESDLLPRDPFLNNPDMYQMPAHMG